MAQISDGDLETSLARIYVPLSGWIGEHRRRLRRCALVGICGPQGSGKTVGVSLLQRLLIEDGWRVASFSLDDLYLTRAERRALASSVHPLLATRGPPGAHDVPLGERLIGDLLAGRSVAIPSFDKAADDRRPPGEWSRFQGPADVVLFEGWCVGARPQDKAALILPVNALERDEDPDGVWRRYVDRALDRYQSLFSHIDLLVQIRPPSFEVVAGWRRQQEHQLRASLPPGADATGVMSDEAVDRFISHYERITREIIRDMPGRADALIDLGPARELRRLEFR